VLWRISAPDGTVLADRARWPKTGRERRKGLLGTSSLAQGEGIILERAYQVHTFGMNYPIDVVFCTKDWKVVHVVDSMKAHRLGRFVVRGFYAIELPAGTTGVSRGDRLEVTRSD
jgi:uncharacterized membrane protein (UPF0127 family)